MYASQWVNPVATLLAISGIAVHFCSAGGHSVFYNMGLGVVAGPSKGFGDLLPSLADTLWSKDVVGFALEAIPYVGEYATGFGEVKAGYDVVAYALAAIGCGIGVIH